MKRLLNFLFQVGVAGALWRLANAALTLANIPTPANASVQVGATAITDAVVSVAATGGEYTTRDIKTLNNTYSVAGGQDPYEVTVQVLYTDGETTDVWDTVYALLGTSTTVTWTPKTLGFTITGTLFACTPPGLSVDDDILFEFKIRGSLSTA